ncbi:Ferrienterobactin-binding periplasmic protein precursor [Vibrio aerogenes CECT 7868]|uniref:Ferrienterobactin-binding periplasmic protein n=1 Tax=Vibrio aerogenes CECT 7868 TaxID=1216006 RepID=A0A1M5XBP9_9VIBR|nr:Fe2+-enterobactin ABC transporter substrate-binding protein [Vibrio aerogenes]SHH97241.1 Ferrienterobactin-binding periplasmic protein precursor [Vibrio aerogenes CECT 7868]
MKNIFLLVAVLFSSLTFANDAVSDAESGWPRVFHNDDGTTTTIPAKPRHILSTSVTVTGTLLAIGAPVQASAATVDGRFFGQWKSVASQRGVQKLWSAGSVDLESVYVQMPDLIVVSASGADSAMAQLAELKEVAPVIVVDYSDRSWQSLAIKLGQATGLTKQAKHQIDAFRQLVSDSRAQMTLPEGMTNIISYHGAGVVNAVAKPEGAHARLLASLGFRMEAPDPAWQTGVVQHRDFLRVNYENLTRLKAHTTFLLASGDSNVQRFIHDPVLRNQPSVRAGQVYGLGQHSFRIDMYSATEIIHALLKRFGPETATP